ncbi:MAG: DMT family transporter [Proteobacteria bacterium]|nr:DMT family transporter [Pseudomonadota bacterium]
MQKNQLKGVAIMLMTVLIWGATFPVAKSALQSMDAYWMSSIRYGLAAPLFIAILYWREGAAALGYRGKFLRAAFFGVIGFTGFSSLVFVGLTWSRPEHGAIIMALQTPMTAFAHWALKGARPANFTLGCVAVAILGVIMVITKGDLVHTFLGGTLLGDGLIFLGAMSWVVYTVGAVSFPGWSALRFTALTALPGTAGILAVAGIATAAGYANVPDASTVISIGWELTYLSLLTVVLAVLLWNMAVGYLGALNAMLLGNLVPVVTFGIRILQGYRFDTIELAGAALVVAALIANNLYLRAPSGNSARRLT